MSATLERMRAVTLAARSVSYDTVLFRPECRQCPTHYDKGAIDSIITEVVGEGANRMMKIKRERIISRG